jgi:hypothetical protein
MLSAARPTCFLIADISGYTGYLAEVELDHAQDILADLIGAVVSALRPNFRLAKLEGDAAFTYVVTETIDGSMLLDTIERCYLGSGGGAGTFARRRPANATPAPGSPISTSSSSSTMAKPSSRRSPAARSSWGPTSSSPTVCSRTRSSRRWASAPTP